ncbi:collagen binding domain-containing protein, partial [Furfurilactobacillus milii]
MSNKSRHRRLLFMMGLVLFSLLGSIWISSNNGMTVYADSKINITQNGTGSGSVINQQEEPQISTVNSNTTDNANSSDDQTSQKQVTNTEAQPRAPTEQGTMSVNESTSDSGPSKQVNSVTDTSNTVINNTGMTVYADSKTNITQNGTGSGSVINQQEEPQISTVNSNTTDNTNSSDDQTSQKQVTNTEAQPRAPTEQGTMSVNESTSDSGPSKQVNSVTDTSNTVINNTGNITALTTKSITDSRKNSLNSRLSAKKENIQLEVAVNTKEDDRDWGNQFITKAELQDESGNPKTDFGIYDNMQAAWNFVIPANKAKSGDTMTVAIPSVLTLATMTNFDITYADGTVIGRAAANPNTGKITITLTDAVKNNHNTITGSFKLWVHWNADKIEKNKLVSVNWGTSGSTNIHVEPSNGPDPNEVLYKWGWYDTNNPYIIYWRVRINYAGKTINQAVYTDRVDDNQALVPGSVSVYKVKYQSDGSKFNILSTYPSSSTIENGTSGFTTTLGDISSPVVIDYKTKITNNGISAHYKNNGKLAGSNIEKQTIDVYSPNNGGNGNADTILTISGTKTWRDNNNQDGIRPSSITVNLLANGQQVASKTVSASDNWQYSFDNL